MKFCLLLSILVCPAIAVFAQDRVEMERRLAALPSDAPGVIDLAGIDAFKLVGDGGVAKIVAVEGQPFASAQQIRTIAKPENPYALQLSAKTAGAIKKGDVLLATFWARAIGADEARTEFVLELAREPHTKSAVLPAALDSAWTKFYVPCSAACDLAPGEGQIGFRCGYDPQTIELAALTVRNFGNSADIKALPYTPTTYPGRASDAAWRSAAAERIEKIRKATLAITVTDADGKPVPGAKVRVVQKKHAFGWGTAVDAKMLLADGPDADRYRATLLANFNKAVIENHLKWPLWVQYLNPGMEAVGWLRTHGLPVRGHCLVWPGKMNLPKDIIPLFAKPEALRLNIYGHISNEVGALRGQCAEWDVLNEPFTNTDVQAVLGDAEMIRWFHLAHEADPDAQLFINDYSILETGGRDAAHQDHYFKTIQFLLDAGAPVQGIGIQGHFSEDLTAIPRLLEILDRFAALGLPIQITELDINTYDETLAADYTRDFLTAMFSHASIGGVVVWGFWEKRHWIPAAAFYRAAWSLRPAGEMWKQLTQKTWWTDAVAQTDAGGRADVRGFLGDYEVTASASGKMVTANVALRREGAGLEMKLR